MTHGQFYRSEELVKAVHKAEGFFSGFRAAHAYGRIYASTFTATPAAKAHSRAAHFQGVPVPVTARFSGSTGDPNVKPSNIVAMATKSLCRCRSRASSVATGRTSGSASINHGLAPSTASSGRMEAPSKNVSCWPRSSSAAGAAAPR